MSHRITIFNSTKLANSRNGYGDALPLLAPPRSTLLPSFLPSVPLHWRDYGVQGVREGSESMRADCVGARVGVGVGGKDVYRPCKLCHGVL
eukprot:1348171-Amorphochlora_amoeboformis.AAC.1